jgi:hypothetical protein
MDNEFTEFKERLKRLRVRGKLGPEHWKNMRSNLVSGALPELVLRELIMEWEREQLKSEGFSDRLLCLMPLKYRERAYEPAKCDAEASRLERLEKDGNEVAANREYHREMRKVVFFTFLTLPIFLMGEILARVQRMVAR